MASPLLFSICALVMLHMLRERFRLNGQVKAASAVGWSIAVVVLVPVASVLALMVVAPGYLQSMAAADGKWMIGGAIFAQVLGSFFINSCIKKIIDIKV
jgi:Flp pilus assembly protein TadB